MTTIHARQIQLTKMRIRKTKKELYIVSNIFSHHIAHTVLPHSFDFHHSTTHIYPSQYTPLSPLPYAALPFTSLHFPSLHFSSFHYTFNIARSVQCLAFFDFAVQFNNLQKKNMKEIGIFKRNCTLILNVLQLICIYRMSQEECARLREGVPYIKVYRYNPKHLCPNLNGYGDNSQRNVKL